MLLAVQEISARVALPPRLSVTGVVEGGVKCEVVKCEVRCEVGCEWSVASGSPSTLPNGN